MTYVKPTMQIPRSKALSLARYEAMSLRARAAGSGRCGASWARAADMASATAGAIRVGKNGEATRLAMRVGPLWKAAAECEGFAVPMGATEPTEGEFDIEAAFAKQSATIGKIRQTQEATIAWRKVATVATIAGALFAMVRLTDIYFAVKARKRGQ